MNRVWWVKGFLSILLVLGLLTAFVPEWSYPQQDFKIGHVNFERIQKEYKGFQDAQAQFNKELAELQKRAKVMQDELAQMKKRLESRRLMLTEEKRREETALIAQKEQTFLQFMQRVDQQVARRNQELTQPILNKILSVVEKIAQQENYAYVLDQASVVYANPTKTLDLTEKVLEELRKEVQ